MTEFNDLSSLTRYLATRRSGSPRAMIAPGLEAKIMEDLFRSYWWLIFPIAFFAFGACMPMPSDT